MQGSTVEPTVANQRARLVMVCAWCRTLLRPAPRGGHQLENFGICSRCLREQLSQVHGAPLS